MWDWKVEARLGPMFSIRKLHTKAKKINIEHILVRA
jgi:hypothetical protein